MGKFHDTWMDVIENARAAGFYPFGPTLPAWTKFMQEECYRRRMHGDLLNKSIVDEIVRLGWMADDGK